MNNILFIHGAWHRENCWNKVREILEKDGISTHAVTLSGTSSKAEFSYEIDEKIVIDKINSIEGDIIVLAHSSAGHLLENVLPKIEHKVKLALFNNSWILPHGFSQSEMSKNMKGYKDEDYINVSEAFVREKLARGESKEVQDELLSILVPQAAYIMNHKADLESFKNTKTQKMLLYCTRDGELYKKMFNDNCNGEIVEIEGCHEMFFCNPEEYTMGIKKCLRLIK